MGHYSSSFTPLNTDTKRTRWARVLLYYQSLSDALAANSLDNTDSLRAILVKVLRAIVNHG